VSAEQRPLVLATNNPGKVREIRELLLGLPVIVTHLGELADPPQLTETHDSFAGNAREKALAVARATGELALADDSGLVVDALGGAPGVLSSRYAGEGANDADLVAKLLAAMEGVPAAKRTARFVCVLILAGPKRAKSGGRRPRLPIPKRPKGGGRRPRLPIPKRPKGGGRRPRLPILSTGEGTCGHEQQCSEIGRWEGQVEGQILTEPRGEGGFGYDPVFYYPPAGVTFAEMAPEEKNEVSHRGRALQQLRRDLPEILEHL